MVRTFIGLVALLALLVLAGCGGVGSPFRGETPFVGSYAGAWTTDSASDYGMMTLTVGKDAVMAGTFRNIASGETGSIDGEVQRDGNFTAEFKYADGTRARVAGKLSLQGSTGEQWIAGDASYTRTGRPTQGMTFDLDSSASPFTGSYAGPWRSADGTQNGNFTFSISTDGILLGVFTNAPLGQSGSIEAAVERSGKFNGVLLGSGGTRTPIRGVMQFAGSETSIAGSGTIEPEGQSPLPITFLVNKPSL